MSTLGVPRRCGQCPAAYALGPVRLCPVLQRAGKSEAMQRRGVADDCIADAATLERFAALFAERRGLTTPEAT